MNAMLFYHVPARAWMVLLLCCNAVFGFANADTIRIDGSHLKPERLQTGTHRYLVYIKMSKESSRTFTQFWTRSIERVNYQGTNAIKISQEWEDKDSVMHRVTSYCNAANFAPLYHESWWKQKGSASFDYINNIATVNGRTLDARDTTAKTIKLLHGFENARKQFQLNWHLDLETFPLLPYKKGASFLIPFYEPGYETTQWVPYTVTGTAALKGYDHKSVPCWLLQHESKGNKEVFWISKKTFEVLKLEQEINGKMYRYKIKLMDSN